MKKLFAGLFLFTILTVGIKAQAFSLSDALAQINNLKTEIASLQASLQAYAYGFTSVAAAPIPFVLTPNGGETIKQGSNYLITWKAPTGVSTVNISIDTGVRCITTPCPSSVTIATGVKNNGSYSWYVDPKIAYGSGSGLKMVISNGNYTDASDATFSIVAVATTCPPIPSVAQCPPGYTSSVIYDANKCIIGQTACTPIITTPSITVISPNGGETYTAGQQIIVKWKSQNLPLDAKIRVVLSAPRDLVSSYNPPTYYVSNTGSTTFTLPTESDFVKGYPAPWGKNFQLVVSTPNSNSTGALALDLTDDTFSINAATTICPVGCTCSGTAVTCPVKPVISCLDSDNGNIYMKGSTSNPNTGVVTLTDSCANKVYYGPGVGTDGYQYETTSSCGSGTSCYLGEAACDATKANWTQNIIACPNGCNDGACILSAVTIPSIAIISPNESGDYLPGSDIPLSWLSTGVQKDAVVDISYSTCGNTSCSSTWIKQGLSSTGKITWKANVTGSWYVNFDLRTKLGVGSYTLINKSVRINIAPVVITCPPAPVLAQCPNGTTGVLTYDANNCVIGQTCNQILPIPVCVNGATNYPACTITDMMVCCGSFGYGSQMVKTNETYLSVPKSQCITPVNLVGGGKEIVANSFCPTVFATSTTVAATPTTTAGATVVITRTLKVGMKGEDVKVLQTFLGITADGSFGPVTKAKVMEWQAANGLTPDGAFGPASLLKSGLSL